jgi:hypothetical protein
MHHHEIALIEIEPDGSGYVAHRRNGLSLGDVAGGRMVRQECQADENAQ